MQSRRRKGGLVKYEKLRKTGKYLVYAGTNMGKNVNLDSFISRCATNNMF